MKDYKGECPLCGAEMELNRDTIKGELKDCAECGTELEVTGLHPIIVSEAPQEEEDWGQ